MKRLTQITGAILLAAALFIVFVILTSGGSSIPALGSAAETDEEQGFELGSYSKMAWLFSAAPDERIAMPVKGVRIKQVADTWGAARSEGRRHSGQDIFAKRGTPVYSATSGYVLRVGEGNLGGKSVFVLGAGGRRYYYAHLDDFAADLKAGDFVTTSSLLGYVGNTGNAVNTPPHLHFGVYGTGSAINPLTLLTDRT